MLLEHIYWTGYKSNTEGIFNLNSFENNYANINYYALQGSYLTYLLQFCCTCLSKLVKEWPKKIVSIENIKVEEKTAQFSFLCKFIVLIINLAIKSVRINKL